MNILLRSSCLIPNKKSHVYLHIPFCVKKCSYCALYSQANPSASQIDAFIAAAANELRQQQQTIGQLETLYIGGGTPSLPGSRQWQKLLRALRQTVMPQLPAEWSIEANPASLDKQLLDLWTDSGVTRVSLGIQSLNDNVLRQCGRLHNAQQAIGALEMIMQQNRIACGADLIAGLPGESIASWRVTLEKTVAIRPQHISVYGLAVEPGTGMERQIQCNEMRAVSHSNMLRRLSIARTILRKAGYLHYEISNFALQGHACRHNLNCWQGGDYAGIGPGASGRKGLHRYTNLPDVESYTRRLLDNQTPKREEEKLDPFTDMLERYAFRLRLLQGAELPEEISSCSEWGQALQYLRKEKLITRRGKPWHLTSKGRNLADHAIGRLLQCERDQT